MKDRQPSRPAAHATLRAAMSVLALAQLSCALRLSDSEHVLVSSKAAIRVLQKNRQKNPGPPNAKGCCNPRGCTNPEALNYDEKAVDDDGTCDFQAPALDSQGRY